MRPPEKPETEAEAQEGAVDSERKIPPEAAPPQNVSASRMSESVTPFWGRPSTRRR